MSDQLIEQLEAYARTAADKVRLRLGNVDRQVYMNFLNLMYHYTKRSKAQLEKAASVSHNDELRNHFHQMAEEERNHYLLAEND
jgi:hypothetical protein